MYVSILQSKLASNNGNQAMQAHLKSFQDKNTKKLLTTRNIHVFILIAAKSFIFSVLAIRSLWYEIFSLTKVHENSQVINVLHQ